MKNVTYVTIWGAYLFSKVHICDEKKAYLNDIANLENLPFRSHVIYSKLSKMLKGNICNWPLQGIGAITRVLAYCNTLAR